MLMKNHLGKAVWTTAMVDMLPWIAGGNGYPHRHVRGAPAGATYRVDLRWQFPCGNSH